MPVYKDIASAIGRTPLVQLDRLARERNALARVLVKIESMNPLGSVKDRIGISMIQDAEQKGLIEPGKTILVEPTSGNTGIALAFVAAARGYELILTMPETMSIERRKMLTTLGAKIVLTPGASGMKGAVARAEEIVATTSGAYCLGQFSNPANPLAHRKTQHLRYWPTVPRSTSLSQASVPVVPSLVWARYSSSIANKFRSLLSNLPIVLF